MQNVLIALETDLASSIALRYACRFEKLIRFNMQVVHIPDLDEQNHPPGGGWVHRTWENAVVQQSGREIRKLIREERGYCYSAGEPKIIPGEKDQVILEELRKKRYDFFIEGFLHSFEPDRFFKKLDSDLYRHLPCPALMVKNMVDPDRGIQIVGTPDTFSFELYWFFKILSGMVAEPDILVCRFKTSGDKATLLENDRDLISGIETGMLKYGKAAGRIRTAEGSSDGLAALVRDHALLVSPLPESGSPMAHMLSRSPCPILFCPEPKK